MSTTKMTASASPRQPPALSRPDTVCDHTDELVNTTLVFNMSHDVDDDDDDDESVSTWQYHVIA